MAKWEIYFRRQRQPTRPTTRRKNFSSTSSTTVTTIKQSPQKRKRNSKYTKNQKKNILISVKNATQQLSSFQAEHRRTQTKATEAAEDGVTAGTEVTDMEPSGQDESQESRKKPEVQKSGGAAGGGEPERAGAERQSVAVATPHPPVTQKIISSNSSATAMDPGKSGKSRRQRSQQSTYHGQILTRHRVPSQ